MNNTRLKKNVIALFILQGTNYLLPLLTVPYLVRVLGVENFGRVAFAYAFIQYFVVLTDYGFNLSATQKVAILRDDPVSLSRFACAVLSVKALLMLLGFGILLGIVLTVPGFRADWVLYVLVYLSVVGSVLFPIWLLQGLEQMRHITVLSILSRVLMVVAIFVWVRHPDDYPVAALLQASGTVIAGGLAWYAVIPRVTQLRWQWPGMDELRRVAVDGWSVFLSTASINLYTNSNVVLLGLLASPAAVGHFVAAEKLIKALKGLIDPVSQAFYPHISARSRQDRVQSAQSISKLALYLGSFFFMVSLALWMGADVLVTVLYGAGQENTASLLRLMAFIPFVLALATCYATLYMLAFGYKQAWGKLIRSTIVVNFASLLVCGWWLPFEQAVAITLLVNEVWVLSQSYLFWRKQWPMEAAPQ